jgi:hypothetical protein
MQLVKVKLQEISQVEEMPESCPEGMETDYRKIRKSDRIKVNGEEMLDPEDIIEDHKVNSDCIKFEQALMRRRKKRKR